jgi:hypothetical protein
MMADLYTVTLLNGTVLRFTSADIPLTIGGNTFLTAPLFMRGPINLIAGLEVDDLQMTFLPAPTDMIGSITFAQAAYRGMLDNATVLMERAFFSPTWTTYASKIIRFKGTMQDIQTGGRTQIPVTVKSDIFLLNVKLPVDIYQPGCRRVLYDTGCTAVKSSFGTASTVLTGSTTTLINCGLTQAGGSVGQLTGMSIGSGDGTTLDFTASVGYIPLAVENVYINGVAQFTGWGYTFSGDNVLINFVSAPGLYASITADVSYSQSGWFDLGTVTFTSGANTGVSRTVKTYQPGSLAFSLPWPNTPAPGDTFTAYAGCDKQQSTCNSKFANVAHFSAEPFVPAAESAF